MVDNPRFNRVFAIILDSVGVGNASDAAKFGDAGADTLGHVANYFQGHLTLPTLTKLGLGACHDTPLCGLPAVDRPLAAHGQMRELSAGKGGIEGHWELMGLPIMHPLTTYPNGFPDDIIREIRARSGHDVLANRAIPSFKVLDTYGDEHVQTGKLIVYTTADSVMGIAAHEASYSVEELYSICAFVRGMVNGPDHVIGRVIAKPFTGTTSNYSFLNARRDFSLEPTMKTVLLRLQEHQEHVVAIGKVTDIFSEHGIDEAYYTQTNADGMRHLDQVVAEDFSGVCFANLVDFDANYGHPRNPTGYGNCLERFDRWLSGFLPKLRADDLLILTADHGNDPTFRGYDHTRERVPLLAYSPSFTHAGDLGIRKTMADVGATILENFNLLPGNYGTSFLAELH